MTILLRILVSAAALIALVSWVLHLVIPGRWDGKR